MTDEQEKMQHEMDRVKAMMAEAIAELECDGGDIRFFTAAALTASVQLCVEVEGVEALNKAVSGIARRELIRSGTAGQC